MKNIKLSPLTYEMLLELAKASRSKPEAYLENLIKTSYQRQK